MLESRGSQSEFWVPSDIGANAEFPRLPITPLIENYAQVPFTDAFNVEEILIMASERGRLQPGHPVYLVDFGSKVKPNTDYQKLIDLDDAAHREAAVSKGFLLYFRGDLDTQGFNRSFCVWETMQDGKLATKQIAHQIAARSAQELYDWYQVTMRDAWLTADAPGFAFGIEANHSYRSEAVI